MVNSFIFENKYKIMTGKHNLKAFARAIAFNEKDLIDLIKREFNDTDVNIIPINAVRKLIKNEIKKELLDIFECKLEKALTNIYLDKAELGQTSVFNNLHRWIRNFIKEENNK